MWPRKSFLLVICILWPVSFGTSGCRQGMYDQPRSEPFEENEFFSDRAASRPLPPHTVPRDAISSLPTDQRQGPRSQQKRTFLQNGRQCYEVYCSPCHDRTGGGMGMVVQRGFKQPPSFHTQKLRQVSDTHIEDVIAKGLGEMSGHASQIASDERAGILLYLRALQFSQHAPMTGLPEEDRRAIAEAAPPSVDVRAIERVAPPGVDMRAMRNTLHEREERVLSSYGQRPGQPGVARIPIRRAIEIMESVRERRHPESPPGAGKMPALPGRTALRIGSGGDLHPGRILTESVPDSPPKSRRVIPSSP